MQPYLFQLDDIFYAGLAYVLILRWSIWLVVWLGSLCTWYLSQENWRIASIKLEQAWSPNRDNSLGHQMGLTLSLSAVPMATMSIDSMPGGLIRFIILHTPISSSLFHNLWVTAIIRLKEQKWRERSASPIQKDAHFFYQQEKHEIKNLELFWSLTRSSNSLNPIYRQNKGRWS